MARNKSEAYPQLLRERAVIHGACGTATNTLRLSRVAPSLWLLILSRQPNIDARAVAFVDHDKAAAAYKNFPTCFWYAEDTPPSDGWSVVPDGT